MKNIQQEWNKISKKFHLGEPKNLQIFLNDKVKKLFRERLVSECLVITDTSHMNYLVSLIEEYKFKICNFQKENYIEMAYSYQEIVVVLFEGYKNEVISSLSNKNIIDLYQEIRFNYNFIFMYPIYKYQKFYDYTYNTLNDSYKNYLLNNDAMTLGELIKQLLYRKDFSSAFLYIDIYIEKKFPNSNYYNLLKNEIQDLLLEIKKTTSERNQKDIIVFWIDQLCYTDLKKCPYLNKIAKNSLFFERAYTITPYTEPTIRYIFLNEKTLDRYNKICIQSRFKKCEHSRLHKCLKQNGYTIKFLVPDEGKYGWKTDSKYYESNYPSSLRLWEMLGELVEYETPVFILIDCLRESHEPFWNPFIIKNIGMQLFKTDYEDVAVNKQQDMSLEYIDHQIKFYSELLCGSNMLKVYMSDHGKWNRITDRRYSDRALHSLLFIIGNNIKNENLKQIFSLNDFYKLINNLIQGEKVDCLSQEVHVQDTCLFNKDLRKFLSEQNDESVEEILAAFSGVIGTNDKYIKLKNGKEYYYILPDEKTNYIQNVNYCKNIQKYREMTKNDFKVNMIIKLIKVIQKNIL